MRQRHTLLLSLLALLGIIWLLRHHIRDILDVATTYSTFYPYLERHPETLYRFPGSANEFNSAQGELDLAPQIIHQIFLTEGRNSSLSRYDSAIRSCQVLHPNWTYHLWQDEKATTFVAQHYPKLLPHYVSYKQSIQRADILRYALLDHFGGVYLDLDITCLQPLDDLRHLPFLTPGAHPAGVNNAFILSRPHHGVLQHVLSGVASRNLPWVLPYVENMMTAGCMFFSNRWMSYVHALSAKPVDESRVYVLANQAGNIESHMLRGAITTPLFKHGGASSWHGWDAAAFILIGKHYFYFAGLLGCGLLLTAFAIRRVAVLVDRKWHALMHSRLEDKDDTEALIGWKEG